MLGILSILNLLISIGLVIGGLSAFHYGFMRTANAVQERVIHALESEITSLKDRLNELEKENAHLTRVIAAIRRSMRQRGLLVSSDSEAAGGLAQAGLPTRLAHIQGDSSRPKED